ncbi:MULTISPECIES: hypothetical protein [Herbaspirillum]|uniref:Lipoprotein n=1 Tax=Herbaspirillum rubrisubalbicans TaxID=80842 RepID=A0AAD0UC07_9BURK|nr:MULTISPECIES: hypothetical protein [Herbaspirillum]AYR24114.1 hypothetical protein RC54_09880 [Herbaspirillum rubrisubalbicans]
MKPRSHFAFYLAVLPAALLLGGCVAVPANSYGGTAVYSAPPVYSTAPYYAYPAYPVYPAYPGYSYPSSSFYFGYSSGWGGRGRWR